MYDDSVCLPALTRCSNIEGYRHLNLPGSTTNANSTLTGGGLAGITATSGALGGLTADTFLAGEVRSGMPPRHAAGSSSCLPAAAAAAERKEAAAALAARCSVAGTAAAAAGKAAAGDAVGVEHAEKGVEGARAAGVGSSDGSKRSRLCVLPCKRPAEGQSQRSE
jgi:hypothetical protein